MGKFVNGAFVDLAIEPIVQRANAITISVNFGNGKPRKVLAAEFIIEQTFIDAIKGDVKAHKEIMKWSKKYLHKDKKPVPITKSRLITQADIDQWKAAGALVPQSSGILEKMNLAELNRSYRAFNHSQGKSRNSTMTPRKLRGLFNELRKRMIAMVEADVERTKE